MEKSKTIEEIVKDLKANYGEFKWWENDSVGHLVEIPPELWNEVSSFLTQVQEETLERVREIIEHGGTGHTVLVIRPDEYDGRPFIDERQLLEALKSLSHPTSSDVTNTRK